MVYSLAIQNSQIHYRQHVSQSYTTPTTYDDMSVICMTFIHTFIHIWH